MPEPDQGIYMITVCLAICGPCGSFGESLSSSQEDITVKVNIDTKNKIILENKRCDFMYKRNVKSQVVTYCISYNTSRPGF